jgi:UDP-glucose 4-epimerase
MTIWVTGANGFIGRHLAHALAHARHSVHGVGHGVLDDVSRGRVGIGTWLNGEIDATNLHALAGRTGVPTLVYHLAGGSSVGLSISQPLEDFSRTVASTARLLEWLRTSAPSARLIVVSSAAVYGAEHAGPIAEADATVPMSPYGQHKLMMEQLCRSYAVTFGVKSSIVRLFSVYGSRLRKQLLWDLCSRLHLGERKLVLGGTGEELRDWTEIRDVVRLLLRVGFMQRNEDFCILNGGSGHGTSVAEIARLLATAWDNDVTVAFSGNMRAGDPFSLVADDRALRAIGFDWAIPTETGIASYVDWFRTEVG